MARLRQHSAVPVIAGRYAAVREMYRQHASLSDRGAEVLAQMDAGEPVLIHGYLVGVPEAAVWLYRDDSTTQASPEEQCRALGTGRVLPLSRGGAHV